MALGLSTTGSALASACECHSILAFSATYKSKNANLTTLVRWEVRCEQPESQVLAEGPRLLASSDWTNFEFESDIPEACHYQQLRLVSAGTRRFEVAMAGAIWFDDMRITRVRDTATAAEPTTGEGKSGAKPDQVLRVGESSR